jgi:hypothetical protein
MTKASKGERERFVQEYLNSQRQKWLDIRDKLLTGGLREVHGRIPFRLCGLGMSTLVRDASNMNGAREAF